MAGIGKKTLAEYIFKSNYNEFERSSFVEEIEKKCAETSGVLFALQKQLLGDVLKKHPTEIRDAKMHTAMIEKALFEKQALVVLDGFDNFEQLDVLIGNKGLCPQSKIIITTKDGSLTEKCALFRTTFPPIHKKYQLFDFTVNESLRLLCWHSFGCDAPKEGYEEEVERQHPFYGGHPLTLKVLGGYLIDKNVATWRDVLKMLTAKEIPTNIHRVLRISFDSLPSENCKELFKHIACFFVGADLELTERILK